MRTEPKFLLFAGTFSLVVAAVYWLVSYERAGSTLLLFMFLAPAFVGAYLVHRGWKLRRPEDRAEADPSEGAGAAVGRFHEASAWPLVMALGAAVAGVGLVFGAWPLALGLVVVALAVGGLMRESRS
ncbi:MAG TPA: cytochrome c oxidase subunit 4 [Actinomycetota bacterium]|nr:cytochrome c oxidase subunit 4 [Actinomycetota bacterium]